MATWGMSIAWWKTKAPDTHSEYVIFIAFLKQQWLCKHTSVLLYICRLSCYLPFYCWICWEGHGGGGGTVEEGNNSIAHTNTTVLHIRTQQYCTYEHNSNAHMNTTVLHIRTQQYCTYEHNSIEHMNTPAVPVDHSAQSLDQLRLAPLPQLLQWTLNQRWFKWWQNSNPVYPAVIFTLHGTCVFIYTQHCTLHQKVYTYIKKQRLLILVTADN